MSALPQPAALADSAFLITELDAMLRIGQVATSFSAIVAALDAIAGVVLRVRGIHQISIEGNKLPRFVRCVPAQYPARGTARAFVAAGGREWARLRLDFELESVAVESPVRFARFIGQQIALLLNRLSIAEDAETRKRQVSRLKARIEMRKLVPRARGILARRLRISEQHALKLLIREARRSRRPLSNVARSVIWGYDVSDFLPPKLRRLQSDEVTSHRNSPLQSMEAGV